MEQEKGDYKSGTIVQDKAYFHSDTPIKLESTDVKKNTYWGYSNHPC